MLGMSYINREYKCTYCKSLCIKASALNVNVREIQIKIAGNIGYVVNKGSEKGQQVLKTARGCV